MLWLLPKREKEYEVGWGSEKNRGRRDMIEIHGVENFQSENKTFKINKEAKLKKNTLRNIIQPYEQERLIISNMGRCRE